MTHCIITDDALLFDRNQEQFPKHGSKKPCKIKGLQGVYAIRARVIPNVEGLLQITLLNVIEKDTKANTRKSVGFIYPVVEAVASIQSTSNLNIKDITFGKNLQPQGKS